jgi:diphosphomevalonate decarboxylase
MKWYLLNLHNWFADLQVSDKRKKVSSSIGMQNSVNTSELLKYRVSHCVPQQTEAIIKV